jgi:opacity protein-like surface antigen
VTEFNFSDRYAFATGIDITYRGGKFKTVTQIPNASGGDSINTSTSSSYTLQYIEIPITLKLKTNEIGYLTYYLQAGVAPGWNIRARSSFSSTTQITTGGNTVTSSAEGDGIDIKDNINNLNFSMIIGGGVEYTLSGSTVMLAGIQFNNGFLDVFDDDPKVNSNYLALTLAVLF